MIYRFMFWAMVLALFLPINAYNGDIDWSHSKVTDQSVSLIVGLYEDAQDFCIRKPKTCLTVSQTASDVMAFVAKHSDKVFEEPARGETQQDAIMTGSVRK